MWFNRMCMISSAVLTENNNAFNSYYQCACIITRFLNKWLSKYMFLNWSNFIEAERKTNQRPSIIITTKCKLKWSNKCVSSYNIPISSTPFTHRWCTSNFNVHIFSYHILISVFCFPFKRCSVLRNRVLKK